jgi:hypothetical protein
MTEVSSIVEVVSKGSKNGNYKHGRYTKEVAATRQWLREATQLLRSFK